MSSDTAVYIIRHPLYWNTVLWRSFCWGLCPQSPLKHIFSEDYVPDPIGTYVLRGRCPWSMAAPLSYDNPPTANSALIKVPLSNQILDGIGHQTVIALTIIVTPTSLCHSKELKKTIPQLLHKYISYLLLSTLTRSGRRCHTWLYFPSDYPVFWVNFG